MNKINKYKLFTINYNIIAKTNCKNIKYLPNNFSFITLLMKNNLITSSYSLIKILFLLNFLSENEYINAFIKKSSKESVLKGIKKFDSIYGCIILKKENLSKFLIKLISIYLKRTFSKFNYTTKSKYNNQYIYIKNIQKVDNTIITEQLQNNLNLEIQIKQKVNKYSTYIYSNNILLLLSHLNFPFN